MKCKPILVIHGGAGSNPGNARRNSDYALSQARVLNVIYPHLVKGLSALEAVVWAAELLENDPLYNSGRGSKIQSDGKIRMSASVMDGARRRFAGCVGVRQIKNPVQLAHRLLRSKDRVLAESGAESYARALKLPLANQYTPEARAFFLKRRKGKAGTIGAVALDHQGRLAAATSTGGRGFEYPHRVSDCPTVAGNFANGSCAVSATGVGEQIVEFAVAARICSLVEAGMPLPKVAKQLLAQAEKASAQFGFIALTRSGQIVADKTTPLLIWGAMSSTGQQIFKR